MAPARSAPRRPYALTALLGGALALTLAACSTIDAPTVDAASDRAAAVAQRTDDGVVLSFRLVADHANDVQVPMKDVRYRLYLDGREVFRGLRSAEATLPTFGSQEVVLPVAVPASEIRASGPVAYRLEGTLIYQQPGALAETLFDAKLIEPSVDFVIAGTIDLAATPTGQAPGLLPGEG